MTLRDLTDHFNASHNHHYHLGVSCVQRSSLSDANSNCPAIIFAEISYFLLHKVRGQLPKATEKEIVRLIDSTTIVLNLNPFEWAHFRKTKGGIKLHTVYGPHADTPTFFEMTAAEASDCKAAKNLPVLPGGTYVFDRAYDGYAWYYDLTEQGTHFVGV